MDKHTAHNIVHTWHGGKAENCPVCKGDITKVDDIKAAAAEVATSNFKPQVNPAVNYNDRIMTYDDKKKAMAGKESKTIKDLFGSDVLAFGEKGKLPDKIKIIPTGKFKTQAYGEVNISKADLLEMADHFNQKVRAGVPIDIDHDQKEAAGWIKSVDVLDDGMYAEVEWTKLGEDKLGTKQYRFFSPEFSTYYIDPEHSTEMNNVLIAGSLVNRPMFKELPPLMASENGGEKNLTNEKSNVMIFTDQQITQEKPMNIKEIIAKEKTTRTSEEQQFLADHKDELTFGEAKAEGFVTAEVKTVTAAEKPAEGMVTISASELATYKENSDKGAQAFSELQKETIRKEVKTLVFNENGGKLAPAQIEPLTNLMFSMSEDNRKVLAEVLKSLPDVKMFGEKGSDENTTLDAAEAGKRMDILAKEKVTSEKISYEAAQKLVTSEHPELVAAAYTN